MRRKRDFGFFLFWPKEIFLCIEFLLIRDSLTYIIIKFRYNARVDWLKQRALSEYRCTEVRCHAISPFVKCLSEFSLGFFLPRHLI